MPNKKRRRGGGVQKKVAQTRAARLADGQMMISDGPGATGEMPPLPEGCHGEPIMVSEGDDGQERGPAVHAPYMLFAQLVDAARRETLPLTLPAEMDTRVDPHGVQQLTELVRVVDGHETDFVRCRCRLLVKGRSSLRPWEAYLDFPTRHVGMVLANGTHSRYEPPGQAVGRFVFPVRKPTWAGSFSFSRVWDDAASLLGDNVEAERDGDRFLLTPTDMAKAETLLSLNRAHLIRVEPEQVRVLPEWEEVGDAWDFAREAGLPFEDVYLDFEGPGAFAPIVDCYVPRYEQDDEGRWIAGAPIDPPVSVHLRGAHVGRDGNGNLVVRPYGGTTYRGRGGGGDRYVSLGSVAFGAHHELPISPMELTISGRDLAPDSEGVPTRTRFASVVASVSTDVIAGLPGYVSLPLLPPELDPEEPHVGPKITVAAVALRAALRVLAALSIMESDAVVVDEAPMEKRDRDRANKRGWKIADMVYIRPTRKGPRSEPTGDRADYSHHFWVSGHFKHFPIGTRMADVRPDLVRPCTRVGDASCGSCRRVWTPPFIKGPDDKPLVVKSLVKRK